MTTYFKSNRFSLFVSIIVFVAIACNNKTEEKGTEKKDTTTTTDTTRSTPPTNQARSGFTGVTLNLLFTDATSFKNLPNNKRMFFVLTYISPDIATLSGWATSNGDFTNNPDIILTKGISVILDQDTTYVGNVKLSKDEVRDVKQAIADHHANYVLFYPTSSTLYPNHLAYDVRVTVDDPALVAKPVTFLTGVVANPSPPKGAN
jgi:hypothetical protein